MTYGTIKVDTVTFTNAGVDKSITLSGLVQNPVFSGNVTVTGTLSGVTVTGTTANFTSGNFTNISGGTHTITSGVFAAGSAASPSITFTGDLNTGIYSPGADQVAISTGGTRRLDINSSGQFRIGDGGTVGVFSAKAATNANLHIRDIAAVTGSGTGVAIDVLNDAVTAVQDIAIRGTTTIFRNNSSESLRITSAGLVGVGTSSPVSLLHVYNAGGLATVTIGGDAASSYSQIQLRNSSTKYNWSLSAQNNVDNGFEITPSTAAGGSTFSTPAVVIKSDGKVGVGTTTVDKLLTLNDTSGATLALKTGANTSSSIHGLEFYDRQGTASFPSSPGQLTSYVRSERNGGNAEFSLTFGTTNSTSANASERLRIDSSGRVGIGTSSPSNTLHVVGTGRFNVSGANNAVLASDGGDPFFYTEQAAGLKFGTNSAVRMTINSSGSVGIGTTSPSQLLHVNGNAVVGGSPAARYSNFTVAGTSGIQSATPLLNLVDAAGSTRFGYIYHNGTGGNIEILNQESGGLTFGTNNTERARIDSSGRLLVGTSSDLSGGDADARLQVNGDAGAQVLLSRQDFGALTAGTLIGEVVFRSQASGVSETSALIKCEADATQGSGDKPGRLVFSTTADGASSPTERMRIISDGDVYIGQTSTSTPGSVNTTTGLSLRRLGQIYASVNSDQVLVVNRNTNDGNLVLFNQDGTQEGNISVSGTTVSYNGAHLSRWSQLSSGAERIEILRGSVLSNIDEMCEWGDEDNEQLNRMKVSDVEGDKNVSGVFQAWDDDDDTYTNDFYCAMTGDFIIRIAAGVTVERGDLLMSAGDGTAKPQDDDIIRSKTIAKVTSTNVSCTYDDGSYCVPCVLMAC